MATDIEFVDGLIVKAPRQGAPEFVKGSISIKRADLGNWLRGKQDEWINVDIKVAQSGKWYAAVNNWKPEQQPQQQTPVANNYPNDPIPNDSDVPF